MATTCEAGPGEFVAEGEMYTLPEARRRTGWGIAAMRAARRDGLKIYRVGRRGYVSGAFLISYIETKGDR